MTIISTYRNHSYKAPRSPSPNKQNYNNYKPLKQCKQEKITTLASLLGIELILRSKRITPINKPKMVTHTIYVWDLPYEVKLPQNIDLYQGMQQFYPNLYFQMQQETNYYDSLIEYENDYEDEAVEEAWAHQDYLEWLCD
jgi:hypothetical protein